MYILAAILFSLPVFLLTLGWRRALEDGQESASSYWRTRCIKAALIVASLATIIGMVFIFNWLWHGGDPHGMGPEPGLWKPLRRLFYCTLVGALALAALGKGKGRFLVLGSVVADMFAVVMVVLMDMD
jgi:hypothetical protein